MKLRALQPADPASILLPIREVARRLSVSTYSVKEAIKAGDLAAVNVGCGTERRVLRISEAALAEYVAARTVTP